MSSVVSYRQQGDVAVVTMDDGKANAAGFALFEALQQALERAAREARALAILGRPGVLSGGFDLNVLRGGDDAEIARLVAAGSEFMSRLNTHPQPVVIAATGHAVALGAFFLLAADYRIAAQGDFRIGLNEVAIGMEFPAFGLRLVQERLARRHLLAATLAATLYSPEQALEVGFVDEVHAASQVTSVALACAARLAQFDPATYAATKAILRGQGSK